MQGVESEMVDGSTQPGVEISQQTHTSVEMVESSGIMEGTSDVLSSEQVPSLEGDLTGTDVQDDASKSRRSGLAVLPDAETSDQDALKIKGPDDASSAQSTAIPAEGVVASGDAAQAQDGQQVTLEGVAGGASGEISNTPLYGFITPDGYAVPFFPGGPMPIQATGGQVRTPLPLTNPSHPCLHALRNPAPRHKRARAGLLLRRHSDRIPPDPPRATPARTRATPSSTTCGTSSPARF